MVIAVDAAGGDFYPENPIKGGIEALNDDDSLNLIFVGPEDLITKELSLHTYDDNRVQVLHAPDVVTMNDSASAVLKSKKQSSISVGISAHKEDKCDAFVSAGNTGALLAASTIILGKLQGVLRPTIAASFPTVRGISLLVDAGANLELKPEMYLQFAKMGTIYSKEILNIDNPTVGLVNVGEEAEKGTELHKETHKLLSNLDNFYGNIEGKDILTGKTDIFLTDGFNGNVILKFGESIPGMLKEVVGKAVKEMELTEKEQQMVYKLLSETMQAFNYERVGGVPFLGIDGVSLVGHGGSSPTALKNMINAASECVKQRVNEKIVNSVN